MTVRKMDRPLETIFDLLTIEQRVACVTDKDTVHTVGFVEQSISGEFATRLCEDQQVLTLHRVAHWLRANANIFKADDAPIIACNLDSLADDLDY